MDIFNPTLRSQRQGDLSVFWTSLFHKTTFMPTQNVFSLVCSGFEPVGAELERGEVREKEKLTTLLFLPHSTTSHKNRHSRCKLHSSHSLSKIPQNAVLWS